MRANLMPEKRRRRDDRPSLFERMWNGGFLVVACIAIPIGFGVVSALPHPILQTVVALIAMTPMGFFLLAGAISKASERGIRSAGAWVMGLGFVAMLVVGFLTLVPFQGLFLWIDAKAGPSAADYLRKYSGAITEAKNGGDLAVGDRCDLAVRKEGGFWGEAVQLRLACKGRGLYGQEEDVGWIVETTTRDGEVVHALDQWDDEGDPGIEFKRDLGTVTYWEKTGARLAIALEGLPHGALPAEHDPAFVPTEQAAPPGVDAAGAIAAPVQRVSETCAPGVVCWAPRVDVSL